jgi:NTE family protein
MPEGTSGALSVYDLDPLRASLGRLVNFDLISQRKVRFSVGAVNVRSGSAIYFDNLQTRIGAEHVLASAALPPAFAPIEIDGECYWDGGIVSNTPLWYAVDHSPPVSVLIVQVDLFNAEGELPKTLDQVMERHKDIMYSSVARFDINHMREVQRHRGALRRLLEKLPARLKADPDARMLRTASRHGHIDDFFGSRHEARENSGVSTRTLIASPHRDESTPSAADTATARGRSRPAWQNQFHGEVRCDFPYVLE